MSVNEATSWAADGKDGTELVELGSISLETQGVPWFTPHFDPAGYYRIP